MSHRYIILSQVRDTSTYVRDYLPTVNPTSFFILLAKVATLPQYSISANLNSPVPEDTYVCVRVDEELSKMLTERYPWIEKYLNDNGTLKRIKMELFA